MCVDMSQTDCDAGRLSGKLEAESSDGQSAPVRRRRGQLLVCRVAVGLAIAAGLVLAVREMLLRNDEDTVCQRALEARDWERLHQSARRWLDRSPRNGDAWMYLALAAENRGDMDWAATAFSRVPDSHPRVADALHKHLALTSGPMNRPLEAAETLERLLVVDPQNPEVHRRAIAFFAQTFQHARLMEQIRSSIRLKCEPPEAYVYLAGADGDRVPEGAHFHDKWVKTYPDCPLFAVAQTLTSVCRHHSEQHSEARGAPLHGVDSGTVPRPEAILNRFPDNSELLALFIERSIAAGDVRDVGRLMDRAPRRTRDDDRFWRYAAWHYAAINEPGEAEAACRHALELQPMSWKSRRLQAALLRSAGRAEEAATHQRLADEGEAIDALVTQIEVSSDPSPDLLSRIAAYASACDDHLVARGIERHRNP